MKTICLTICFCIFETFALGWGRHDLLTTFAIEEVAWLKQWKAIEVTSFQEFLPKAFARNYKDSDFLRQYQLNPSTKMIFKHNEKKGEKVSAAWILIHYTDEPDWGMDQNLDISPNQKFMGGTKGPTSQAFRHLYWKKWTARAPWRTFHIPPREMGEALKRAQSFYDLAQTAFEVGKPYWAFRFLAWSLHYIQDLGQPFHSSQLLTPKFIDWNSIFNFEILIKRTTQIISNYHFMYEDYVVFRIEEEFKNKFKNHFISALKGTTFMNSSSAYLIARHSADDSNRLSYSIGEASYTFFGEQFLDSSIDVPNSPKGKFPLSPYEKSSKLSQKEKTLFLKNTAKSLQKTAFYTRSLLELAKEDFLQKKI